MNNTIGDKYRLTIFGASHAPEIGVRITGIPADTRIDRKALQAFMARRAPGQGACSTSRKEPDLVEFTEGVDGEGRVLSAAVRAVIRNTNVRRKDYDNLRDVPRPGHADLTARLRYGDQLDMSGGGPFSGRMTAPLCIAGGIALQILAERGVSIRAGIREIGGLGDPDQYMEAIDRARAEGDSLGGVIECCAEGVPAGIGDPMFDGIENRIARIVFGIPAVKGIEFGAGYRAARMKGSENNDPFYNDESGQIRTKTNNAGGILGGITNGMPVTFTVAVKPTPSIAKEQESVNIRTGENARLVIRGRHDPCIVPRAVPVVEAACACAILDAVLEREGSTGA